MVVMKVCPIHQSLILEPLIYCIEGICKALRCEISIIGILQHLAHYAQIKTMML